MTSAPASPGTQGSTHFDPALTYVAPAGWSNVEDYLGGVLLLPTGASQAGVDAGTSDYVAIAASVAPLSPTCSGEAAAGVKPTAAAIAKWMTKQPGLKTTAPKAVSVGGLKGVVLDVRLADGWKKSCPYANGAPMVPLIRGLAPSDFDHSMIPGLAIRQYLLDDAGAVLGIEVDDVTGGSHLDQYSDVVDTFRFAP